MARKFNRSTNVLSSNFSSALDRNTGVNVMQRLSDLIAQVYSEDFYKFQSNTFFALVIGQTGQRATDIRTARNTFSQMQHQRDRQDPNRISTPDVPLYPSCKVRILETGHAFIGDPTDPNGVFNYNRLDQYADQARPNRLKALNVAFIDMHGFPAYTTNPGIPPPEYGDVVLVEVDNISDPRDVKILEIVAEGIIPPLSFTTENIDPAAPGGSSATAASGTQGSTSSDSDSQCALGSVGTRVVNAGLEQGNIQHLLNQTDYGFWVFGGLPGLRRIKENPQERQDLLQAGIKNLSIPIDDISSRLLIPNLFTNSPTDELREIITNLKSNFNIYFLTYPQRTDNYFEEGRIENLIENAKSLGISGIQLDLEENWQANSRYNNVQLLEEEASNNILREKFANKGIRIDVTTIYSTARSKAKRPIIEFADNYIAQSFFSNDPVRFGGYNSNTFGMGSTQRTVLRSFQNDVLAGSSSSVKFSYGLTFLNQDFNCETEEITMAKNLLSTKGSATDLGLPPGRLNNEVWYFQYFHWRNNPKVKNFLLNKATYFDQI